MVDISRKMHERNGKETNVDNDGILWLNELWIDQTNYGLQNNISS